MTLPHDDNAGVKLCMNYGVEYPQPKDNMN